MTGMIMVNIYASEIIMRQDDVLSILLCIFFT